MDRFTNIQQIGEGTYGIVYKGFLKNSDGNALSNGELIALKQIRLADEDEGRNVWLRLHVLILYSVLFKILPFFFFGHPKASPPRPFARSRY